MCHDVNECLDEIGGSGNDCDQNANCINNEGSYRCACKNGFAGDGQTCVNSNECVDGTHTCSEFANCLDRNGHFDCECIDGYAGNGTDCADLDECVNNSHDCSINTGQCLNTIGSFKCTCAVGFEGSGVDCYNIDECAQGNLNENTIVGFLFNDETIKFNSFFIPPRNSSLLGTPRMQRQCRELCMSLY